MSGIICSECGRDIDEIGQDNMSCTSEPLCEDCWNDSQSYAVSVLRRENRRLRGRLDAMAEKAVVPKVEQMEIEAVCAAEIQPVRAHEADAGADLRASRYEIFMPGEIKAVPTGVRVAIPKGYVGLLFARSSLCNLGVMLANGVGVIDSGYTGEIKVPLFNASPRVFELPASARIAQLVVVPCELPTFRRVESLEKTERGEGGFGSTGVE